MSVTTDDSYHSDVDFGTGCASYACSGATEADASSTSSPIALGRKFAGESVLLASLEVPPKSPFQTPRATRVGTPGVGVRSRRTSLLVPPPRSFVTPAETTLPATPSSSARSPSLSSSSIEEETSNTVEQTLTLKPAGGGASFTVKTFRALRPSSIKHGGAASAADGRNGQVLVGVGLDGVGAVYAVSRFPIADDDADLSRARDTGAIPPTLVRILRQRFQAVSRLTKARHVLPHYGAIVQDGALYSVAHLACGGSLSDFAERYLAEHPDDHAIRFPVDLVKSIVHQVSRGIARLHEAGIVHGAIRISSVFIDAASAGSLSSTSASDEEGNNDTDEHGEVVGRPPSLRVIAQVGGFSEYLLTHHLSRDSVKLAFALATSPTPTDTPRRTSQRSPMMPSPLNPPFRTSSSPSQAGKSYASSSSPLALDNFRLMEAISPAFLTGTFASTTTTRAADRTPSGRTGGLFVTPNSGAGLAPPSVLDENPTQSELFLSQLSWGLGTDLHDLARLVEALLVGFTVTGRYEVTTQEGGDFVPRSLTAAESAFVECIEVLSRELLATTKNSFDQSRARTLKDLCSLMFATAAQKIRQTILGHPFLRRNPRSKAKKAMNSDAVLNDAAKILVEYSTNQRRNVALECLGQRSSSVGAGIGRTPSFRFGSAAHITTMRTNVVQRVAPSQGDVFPTVQMGTPLVPHGHETSSKPISLSSRVTPAAPPVSARSAITGSSISAPQQPRRSVLQKL